MQQNSRFNERLSKLEGKMKSSQEKAEQESVKQTIEASLAQLTPAEIRSQYQAATYVSPRPEIIELAHHDPQEIIRLYRSQLDGKSTLEKSN